MDAMLPIHPFIHIGEMRFSNMVGIFMFWFLRLKKALNFTKQILYQ